MPFEFTPKPRASDALTPNHFYRAAEIIQDGGLAKNQLTQGSAHCAQGALMEAYLETSERHAGKKLRDVIYSNHPMFFNPIDITKILRVVNRGIDEADIDIQDLIIFNNRPDTTKEMVVDKLRELGNVLIAKEMSHAV